MKKNEFKLLPDPYYPIRVDWYSALERYLNHGISPGGFMMAVLCNNLSEAVGRADTDNGKTLSNIVGYIYNHIPASAWGSPEKVSAWLAQFHETAE